MSEKRKCRTCGQEDVPVLSSVRSLVPHRQPGPCCVGLNCSHGVLGLKNHEQPRPLCPGRIPAAPVESRS